MKCVTEHHLKVSLQAAVDLATEWWRLDRLTAIGDASLPPNSRAAIRHTARRIRQFLRELQIEVVDLTGQPYDPGLAVEVLDTAGGDASSGTRAIIREMVLPVVLRQGTVVRYGQVIIGY